MWDQKYALPFLNKKASPLQAVEGLEVRCTQCPLSATHKTHSWWCNLIQNPWGQHWEQLITKLATQFWLSSAKNDTNLSDCHREWFCEFKTAILNVRVIPQQRVMSDVESSVQTWSQNVEEFKHDITWDILICVSFAVFFFSPFSTSLLLLNFQCLADGGWCPLYSFVFLPSKQFKHLTKPLMLKSKPPRMNAFLWQS